MRRRDPPPQCPDFHSWLCLGRVLGTFFSEHFSASVCPAEFSRNLARKLGRSNPDHVIAEFDQGEFHLSLVKAIFIS